MSKKIEEVYKIAFERSYPMSDSIAREILADLERKPSRTALENAIDTRLHGEDWSAYTDHEMEKIRGSWILELSKWEEGTFDFEVFENIDLSTVVLKARLWAVDGDVEIYSVESVTDLDPSENACMFEAMESGRLLLKVTSDGKIFSWKI